MIVKQESGFAGHDPLDVNQMVKNEFPSQMQQPAPPRPELSEA